MQRVPDSLAAAPGSSSGRLSRPFGNPRVAIWGSGKPGATAVRLAVAAYPLQAGVRLWVSAGDAVRARGAVTWRSMLVATLLHPQGLISAVIPFGEAGVGFYLAGFAGLIAASGFG